MCGGLRFFMSRAIRVIRKRPNHYRHFNGALSHTSTVWCGGGRVNRSGWYPIQVVTMTVMVGMDTTQEKEWYIGYLGHGCG